MRQFSKNILWLSCLLCLVCPGISSCAKPDASRAVNEGDIIFHTSRSTQSLAVQQAMFESDLLQTAQ